MPCSTSLQPIFHLPFTRTPFSQPESILNTILSLQRINQKYKPTLFVVAVSLNSKSYFRIKNINLLTKQKKPFLTIKFFNNPSKQSSSFKSLKTKMSTWTEFSKSFSLILKWGITSLMSLFLQKFKKSSETPLLQQLL